MLDQSKLLQLYQHLGLSKKAQIAIEEIRSSPPIRRVRSGGGNVSVRYPSRKMGQIIQAESHKNELAGVYEKEYDPDTLEYYDQPSQIKLEYQAKSGRQVGVIHTPDYFVIRTDGVGWEEWKTEEKLIELTETMPHRYIRDEEGQWRCPPGERYAEQFGFFYHVRSSAEIDWVFQRNIRFLEDYLADDCPEVSQVVADEVIELVKSQPRITLDELLRCAETASSDDIYIMIATNQIYVDAQTVLLAEPEFVHVFQTQETALAYSLMSETTPLEPASKPRVVNVSLGETVFWDGTPLAIANLGETVTTLLAEDGALVELDNDAFETLVKQGRIIGTVDKEQTTVRAEARELLVRASPADLEEANRRYRIIEPLLKGQPPVDEGTPERTIFDWLAKYRRAKALYNCGYVGLLSRLWQSGNRQRKLPDNTLALLNKFIEDEYETLKQKNKREVYGELILACETAGVIAPSYKTFAKAVNWRPRHEQITKREGKRKAYPHEPFHFELTMTTPRHGDRPFEIVHIDHTELDIELICSRTGRNLGRPWVTFLVDAFSRRLLAVYLTFDPPSYRSCMMVLRECVWRHGRLPQTIVVDGGSDFQSTYFETLLARYECTKKTRPGAKPRYGAVCERLFGTANTTFVHNLIGNTQVMRNVRQVTKSINPKQQACWSLGRLYVHLREWAYEVYDTIDHPALGQTPREAFAMGLVRGGQRSHRLIPFDEDFQMFTLPTTRKGTAMIQPNLGVSINYIYYWSDTFRNSEAEKRRVPVRYDPFDAGLAYAFVKKRWVRCISEHYAYFRGRSEREIMLATAELRRRHRNHSRQFIITARKLAEFLGSLEAEEVLLQQRLRDAAGRQVLMMTQGGQTYEDEPTLAMAGLTATEPTGERENSEQGHFQGTTADTDGLVIYGDF